MYRNLMTETICMATEECPRHSEAAMIELKDGSILMAWQRFEKSKFGSGDQAPATIALMNSSDIGRTWTDFRITAECRDGYVNCYSPNLIRLLNGDIALIFMRYTQLTAGLAQLSDIFMTRSSDEGRTFGEETVIMKNTPYTVSNDCIRRLKSGRILLTVCCHRGELWSPSEHIDVSTMYSDDDGTSWTCSPHFVRLPMRGAMEPFSAQLSDGTLIAVMRNQLGSVFRCYSYDDGVTWTKPQTTGLPAPESCPYITNIPGTEKLLVIWNNSEYDPQFCSHYGKRSPLTAAVTSDGGKTFTDVMNIETDPERAFSNPGVLFTSGGVCLVTYWTCKYFPDWRMGNGGIDLKLASFEIGYS
ncbi:MAG: sialidase family protein [Eubacteriales bacterium]